MVCAFGEGTTTSARVTFFSPFPRSFVILVREREIFSGTHASRTSQPVELPTRFTTSRSRDRTGFTVVN